MEKDWTASCVGESLSLLFLGRDASSDARRNLVEHVQYLLRLLSPRTVWIKLDGVLVSFDGSRLHVGDILVANFL